VLEEDELDEELDEELEELDEELDEELELELDGRALVLDDEELDMLLQDSSAYRAVMNGK